jgi:hypothetical protein
LDDYVLRIVPDAPAEQRALAAFLNERPGGRLLVVQDSNNAAYTVPAYDVFAAEIARADKWEVVHQKTDIAAFRPEELRALMSEGGDMIEGPFDGEEAITLLADLDAGATGTMTSAMIPELIKPILIHWAAGNKTAATDGYARILPAVNHENRQCGFRAAKAAMLEGGVIRSDFCRHPIPPLHPATRAMLLELLGPLDPIALRWGR